uniref:Chromatin complexes subunit BAP18 n=1 Tax=Heterorhabditis bacteriophora TaxID=37862 RepID=A0A1I7XVX7_HETBA
MIRNFAGNAGPSQTANTVTITTTPQAQHQQQISQLPSGESTVNLASKVAEVFLTAGHAFQKLGDLTLQLHTNVEPDECKWTEKDVDQLRDSLTRFAHELDQISESVQGRTTKHIKTDIKRRHLMSEEAARRPASPGMGKRPAGTIPLTQAGIGPKRIALTQAPKAPLTGPSRPFVPARLTTGMAAPPQISSVANQQQQLPTPLLSDPSHHYINTSQ